MANKATFYLLTPTYPLRNMATVSPLTWIGRLNVLEGHLSVTSLQYAISFVHMA